MNGSHNGSPIFKLNTFLPIEHTIVSVQDNAPASQPNQLHNTEFSVIQILLEELDGTAVDLIKINKIADEKYAAKCGRSILCSFQEFLCGVKRFVIK